jgi:multiple sugar transport system permease protein
MKISRKLLFFIPSLIVLSGISLGPLIYAFITSFQNYNIAKPEEIGRFIGIKNYLDILDDQYFIESLKTTLLIVVPAVIVEFVLGLALGSLLSQKIKGKRYIFSFIMIPTFLAPVVVGLVWLFMLHPSFGVLTQVLNALGISGIVFLGDPSIAPFVITLIDIWQWTPFMALVFHTGILSLPPEVLMAAEVDGASMGQKFRHVTLPMLMPICTVMLILRAIDAWRIFDKIWILTGGGPGMSTETAAIYAYRVNFRWWNIGYGAALATTLLIMVGLYSLVSYSKLKR